MTNWMTVTGVALMVGGLAILIVFRRAIFGGGGQRERRRGRAPEAIEAPRRAQLTAAPATATGLDDQPARSAAGRVAGEPAAAGRGPREPAAAPAGRAGAVRRLSPARTAAQETGADGDVPVPELRVEADAAVQEPAVVPGRRSRRGRRRAPVPAGVGGAAENAVETTSGSRRRGRAADRDDLDDRDASGRFRYGLASIGLADEDDPDEDLPGDLVGDGRAHDVAAEQADDAEPGDDAGWTDEHSSDPDGPADSTLVATLDDHERFLDEPDDFDDTEHSSTDGADADERFEAEDAHRPRTEGRSPAPAPRSWADRCDRLGDRVDGWVRPQYHDLPESEGGYWTPVPEAIGFAEPSANGYGWPVPVERLPAVPDYEPATGFDLPPVTEPTAVVPQWPPMQPANRVQMPRSWSRTGGPVSRDEQPRWAVSTDRAPGSDGDANQRRRPVMTHRTPAEARRGPGDVTDVLPSVGDEVRDQRPRPRPRPSTVYVSRHAAE